MKYQLPKLIMFDLDGTIADTVIQLHTAVVGVLKRMNLPTVSLDDTRNYVGNGAQMLLARAISRNNDIDINSIDSTILAQARQFFTEEYQKCLDCSNSLYPNVINTLEFLKNKGIKLAIVSNKPNMFIPKILDLSGLSKYFDYFLGSEVILEKKPNPAPLFYVCNKVGIDIKDSWMVGDSVNDIEAAHNANIVSIGLSYGYNRGRSIQDSHPDFVMNDFGEIKELISSLLRENKGEM
ncbi:MAG: phosphoglycolate phosphatase [Succinivibrionaceae bacterium]